MSEEKAKREEAERLATVDAHKIIGRMHDVLAFLALRAPYEALFATYRAEEHLKMLENELNRLLHLEKKAKGDQ
jgi:hypothetical protein